VRLRQFGHPHHSFYRYEFRLIANAGPPEGGEISAHVFQYDLRHFIRKWDPPSPRQRIVRQFRLPDGGEEGVVLI